MAVGAPITRVVAAAIAAAALLLVVPALASAATLHVSPQGSDAGPGSIEEPFATIGKAAATAGPGDVVEVASGTYPETVTVPPRAANVVFRAAGPAKPVIEGEGVRPFGFVARSTSGITIDGFAIRGQTEAGVYLFRSDAATIANNAIDHIGVPGQDYATGVKVSYGSDMRVLGNTVHSVGPGAQAIGIWLLQTTKALVDDNTVYLVRKEGIRDWQGLDNRISNNRTFLTWSGLSLNTSTGSSIVNNYSYDNVNGIVVKHTSYRTVLDFWGLSEGRMSTIWKNTVWRSTGVGLALGQSGEPFDYVDVRNNVFEDAGLAYIQDMPALRGQHVTVDGNAYAPPTEGRPTYMYKATWREDSGGIELFEDYQQQLGWDANGRQWTPRLDDPGRGDLDHSAGASGGPALPDGTAQLGATGLAPAAATWTPYAMTPIDSSSKGSWYTRAHLDETADNDQFSYWLSETDQNEYVTFDFGQRRTFDLLVLTVFSDLDNRNIHGYRFEVSDDREDWRTILEGENPDSAGSSYKYALPEPAEGRYLRFTMRDTFCDSYAPRTGCGSYFVLSDLRAGSLNAPPEAVGPSRLKLRVKVPRQRLGKVVQKRALMVRASCNRTCSASSKLTGRKGVTLARDKSVVRAGKRGRLVLRLTKAGRNRLEQGTAGKLRLRTTARAADGGRASATAKVRLAH